MFKFCWWGGEEVKTDHEKGGGKKKKKTEKRNTKVSEPLLMGARAGEKNRAIAQERDSRIVRHRCTGRGPVQWLFRPSSKRGFLYCPRCPGSAVWRKAGLFLVPWPRVHVPGWIGHVFHGVNGCFVVWLRARATARGLIYFGVEEPVIVVAHWCGSRHRCKCARVPGWWTAIMQLGSCEWVARWLWKRGGQERVFLFTF